MNNTEKYQQDTQNQLQNAGTIDLMAILNLIIKNWYWFLITLAIALFCARFYISHTIPVYRTSATILINERQDGTLRGEYDMLQGLGLPSAMNNIDDQMLVFRSRSIYRKHH